MLSGCSKLFLYNLGKYRSLKTNYLRFTTELKSLWRIVYNYAALTLLLSTFGRH